MARKKRVYTPEDDQIYWQKKFIINRLRMASRFWPAKKIVLDAAKQRIEIGIFKNGSPKFKIMYKCAKCSGLFDIKQIEVNHIRPVVDEIKGFENWTVYIDRLLCKPNNLECICKTCHSAITLKQRKRRKSKK